MRYLTLLLLLFLFACSSKKEEPAPAAPAAAVPGYSTEEKIEIQPKKKNKKPKKSNVEAIANQLESANIAYNTPSNINIEDKAKIQLLIDFNKAQEELAKEVKADGKVVTGNVLASSKLMAHVSSADFDIVEITPETQILDDSLTTEWDWELVPKSTGKKQIHLEITALVSTEDGLFSHHIKSYDTDITVEVTKKQLIKSFVKNYWQWMISSLLLPLVGIWWKLRDKKKEEKDFTD